MKYLRYFEKIDNSQKLSEHMLEFLQNVYSDRTDVEIKQYPYFANTKKPPISTIDTFVGDQYNLKIETWEIATKYIMFNFLITNSFGGVKDEFGNIKDNNKKDATQLKDFIKDIPIGVDKLNSAMRLNIKYPFEDLDQLILKLNINGFNKYKILEIPRKRFGL